MKRTGLFPLLLCLLCGVAAAENYLPLEAGYIWTYEGSAGDHESELVTGQISFHGTSAWGIHHEVSAFENFDNYWTVDADGVVRCRGFVYPDGSGILYPQGLAVVEPPLWLGKSWSQTVTYYSLPDTTTGGTFELTYQVYEEVDLSVPAGTFHAFGIGGVVPAGRPRGFRQSVTWTGLFGGVQDGQPADWWTDQVGRVRFLGDQTYELESFNLPTPARLSSWGAIKALYGRSGR